MTSYKRTATSTLAIILISGLFTATISTPVQAGHAGAFIGGIAVAKIGRNMRDQRDYQEDQAYYAQQQAQAAQQQAAVSQARSRSSTPDEKMKQLNKMYQAGYITQQEYDQKKQQILSDM